MGGEERVGARAPARAPISLLLLAQQGTQRKSMRGAETLMHQGTETPQQHGPRCDLPQGILSRRPNGTPGPSPEVTGTSAEPHSPSVPPVPGRLATEMPRPAGGSAFRKDQGVERLVASRSRT